jgi:hypothetical protein
MKIKSKTTKDGITRMEVQLTNPFDGKRIYCVVADTVQHPLIHGLWQGNAVINATDLIERGEDTRTISQPAGRLVAQTAHAVSKVRHMMVKDEFHQAISHAKKDEVWFHGQALMFFPITTIVLAARDSFELKHVRDLLAKADIKFAAFWDTNPDAYGDDGEVLTAVATYPVEKNDVIGVLDYLPLWRPRDVPFEAKSANQL